MKAIILAAGEGQRMRNLTKAIPKPLLPVGGVPTIEYVIRNLRTCSDIDEVHVAIYHQAEVLEAYFSDTSYDGLKIHINRVKKWETGGDLKMAAYDAGIDSTFIACFGDNITEIDMAKMLSFHRSKGRAASVALFPVPAQDTYRFGIAELDGDIVTRFLEKPAPGQTCSRLANAGYYALEPSVLDLIPYGKVKFEDKILPAKLVPQRQLAGFKMDPPHWLDIGTPESYDAANKLIYECKGIIAPPVKR